jgi:hypothetical protein
VPSELVEQLALGVGSSVLSGSAVWLGQRMRVSRRTRARRRFLGLHRHGRSRIVVGHKFGSHNSIHVNDVAAALEVSALLRSAGSEPDVLAPTAAAGAPRDAVEFCVSGPDSNERTEAHLRRFVPALKVHPPVQDDPRRLAYQVDGEEYRMEIGQAEYVLVARICRPSRPRLFLVCGQTSLSNRAGALYLGERLGDLRHTHGDERSFGVILRVVDSQTYGHREFEEVRPVEIAR